MSGAIVQYHVKDGATVTGLLPRHAIVRLPLEVNMIRAVRNQCVPRLMSRTGPVYPHFALPLRTMA